MEGFQEIIMLVQADSLPFLTGLVCFFVIGFKMIFQLYIVQVGQLKTGGIEKMGDISCLYEKGNGAIHLVLKLREINP